MAGDIFNKEEDDLMVSVMIDELAWTEYRRRVVEQNQPALILLDTIALRYV